MQISIIVPVYNVEKYLRKSLDSLVCQTIKNYEIIIVEDKSTDNSKQIVMEYEKKYPSKIKAYYHMENKGLGDARNTGLKHANGKYIAFFDSDDYVEPDCYEKLVLRAEAENSSVVEFDVINKFFDHEEKDVKRKVDHILFDVRPMATNKIFRSSIIKNNKLTFVSRLYYEDVAFWSMIVPYIGKLSYEPTCFYYYLQRENQISRTYNKRTAEMYIILEKIYAFYGERKFKKKYHDELEYLYIQMILGRHFYRTSQIKNKIDRKKILDDGYKLLIKRFPHFKKNKYLKSKKGLRIFYYKSINKFTYKLSSSFFHIFGNLIIKLPRKLG